MTKNEKELFFLLCKFKNPEYKRIGKLIKKSASSGVLGELFFNRTQGIAYKVLENGGLLNELNREFRNAISASYEQNLVRNISYSDCVSQLSQILKRHENKYVMLKGAYLCGKFPAGCRTSNDIDLLVAPESVTVIGNTLSENGFKQGSIKNGQFIPASRKEIIASKMMRGETVPYIKQVDLPFLKYLEVDLNFSLDYQNGSKDVVNNIISKAAKYSVNETAVIRIPNKSDFFIHLCCHLYKEASTLPWVRMHRDMTMYKYIDIYMLLSGYSERDIIDIFKRAQELGVSEICACVIKWTCELLDCENNAALNISGMLLGDNPGITDTVVSPSEHKTYTYTEKNIKKRFFASDRSKLLKELGR